jgi:hypothetical protein
MASFRECEGALEGSLVRVHIVEGLNHEEVFEYIDRIFTTLVDFTRA